MGKKGANCAQVIALFGISVRMNKKCAAAIWTALAALPSLHRVEWALVDRSYPMSVEPGVPTEPMCEDLSPFLRHLTKLTHIRWRSLQQNSVKFNSTHVLSPFRLSVIWP